MDRAGSEGMSHTTPTFSTDENVLDNTEHMRAPKKRRCCRRRLGTSSSSESEISVDNLDGYVFYGDIITYIIICNNMCSVIL